MLRVLIATLMIGGTASAAFASWTGWGIAGGIAEPVSIRQGSVAGTGTRGPIVFFSNRSRRRHRGGGWFFGK